MDEIIFCKTGGCGAKLGAGALSKVLEKLPKKENKNLIVGFDSHDDGAVYKINDTQAIISTLDFFPPMVEDPYIFGQIAATNALSDIYAMGGQVISALNIVCFPEKYDINILGKILQGGNDKVIEAGGVLAGGHSINDTDIKYGMSVTGIVNPKKIYRNNTCREGDGLIMTKKLGVGIVMAAKRVQMCDNTSFNEAVKSMTTLNKYTAEVLNEFDIHAVSDITGFGFIVHLSEMVDGQFTAVIDSSKIKMIDHAYDYAKEFCITAAAQKNRNFIGDKVKFEIDDYAMEEILFDPQTSGGFIISVSSDDADKISKKLNENGIVNSVVGKIVKREEKDIIVR